MNWFMTLLNLIVRKSPEPVIVQKPVEELPIVKVTEIPTIEKPNVVAKLALAYPIDLSLSKQGAEFIYAIETGAKPSDNGGTGSKNTKHLHWPKGLSGVTLGPGYDMRERSAKVIEQHMQEIGLDQTTAKLIAGAAFLTGAEARKFVEDKKVMVKSLTLAQELKLLQIISPQYERIVKKWITIELLQSEYDALVCFTYNPGASIVPVAKAINEGAVSRAMDIIKSRVPIEGDVNHRGLVRRREKEIILYTTGHYTF